MKRFAPIFIISLTISLLPACSTMDDGDEMQHYEAPSQADEMRYASMDWAFRSNPDSSSGIPDGKDGADGKDGTWNQDGNSTSGQGETTQTGTGCQLVFTPASGQLQVGRLPAALFLELAGLSSAEVAGIDVPWLTIACQEKGYSAQTLVYALDIPALKIRCRTTLQQEYTITVNFLNTAEMAWNRYTNHLVLALSIGSVFLQEELKCSYPGILTLSTD